MHVPYVRIFTGDDGHSHFEDGSIDLDEFRPGIGHTEVLDHHSLQFAMTESGGTYDWHTAPRRQFVITLTGTLEFETQLGETREIGPGTVLLAEDTTGTGHRWKLIGDDPWRRLYIHL